jgi:hypothetical protein
MARERNTFTQKEGVRKEAARSDAHISDPAGLATHTESAHSKEAFHNFLRSLARELARADHNADG